MALVSVPSIQLSVEPEDEDLKELCEHIDYNVQRAPSSKPASAMVVTALKSNAHIPYPSQLGDS